MEVKYKNNHITLKQKIICSIVTLCIIIAIFICIVATHGIKEAFVSFVIGMTISAFMTLNNHIIFSLPPFKE